MAILVTGAAGAVGSQVVDLLLEYQYQVVATDLHGTKQTHAYKDGVISYDIDLSNPDDDLANRLDSIMVRHRVDTVINTAAIVDIAQPWEVISGVNYKFVELLNKSPHIHKLVHISTGSIYANDDEVISERTPLKTTEECNSPYEKSKVLAENSIIQDNLTQFQYPSDTLEQVTILRPALIYGPRARFLGAALAGIPFINATLCNKAIGFYGGPRTNWVHCHDVARACVWAMDRMETTNSHYSVFNICDDVAYGFGDSITQYIEAYGLQVLAKFLLPAPSTLSKLKKLLDNNIVPSMINIPVKYYWRLLKSLYLLKGDLNMAVDKEAIPYLFQDTIFSNASIKRAGFELLYPDSKEAIPSVVDWYRENKWIG